MTNYVAIKMRVETGPSVEGRFDKSLQRAIRENCGALSFKSAEFDED